MLSEALSQYRQNLVRRAVSKYDYMAVLLPLLVIILAEALFFSAARTVSEQASTQVVLVHAFNIMLCLLIPIVFKLDNTLYQVYSLMSVLRILTIGMPNFSGITLEWMALVYLPFLPVLWFALKDERHTFTMEPGEFPFRMLVNEARESMRAAAGSYREIGIGLSAGAVLGFAGYVAAGLPVLVSEVSFRELLLSLAVLILMVATVEELLFRRMLLSRIMRRFGPVVAISVSALAFAVMHSAFSSSATMAFMFVAGLFLGLAYVLSGRTLTVVVMHGTMLFTALSLYPFLL